MKRFTKANILLIVLLIAVSPESAVAQSVSLDRGSLTIRAGWQGTTALVSLDRGPTKSVSDDVIAVRVSTSGKRPSTHRFPLHRTYGRRSYRLVNKIVFWGGSSADHFENRTAVESLAHGGNGNDVLIGGSSRDELHGDNGDDDLFGNGSDDSLYGGRGNDFVSGGTGDDVLIGHTGDHGYVHDVTKVDQDTFKDEFDFSRPVSDADGVSVFDIQQTGSSICSFMASMAGVAHRTPEKLSSGIVDLGTSGAQHLYIVRLTGRHSGRSILDTGTI